MSLVALGWAQSDRLCPWLIDCEYEAPAFTIRVVDQLTREPLADVHGLASWIAYGAHGRAGPVMVVEAVSGPDGVLAFPGWGPVRSAFPGLLPQRDPLISVFRAGYQVRDVYNATPLGRSDTARVRAFQKPGATFELIPLHGTHDETVSELRKAADPFETKSLSTHDPLPMRRAYVNRLTRLRAEAERLPSHLPDRGQLLWRLDGGIRLFTSGD